MPPRNGTRAARFDPATETWENFGDTFPASKHFESNTTPLDTPSVRSLAPLAGEQLGRVAERPRFLAPGDRSAAAAPAPRWTPPEERAFDGRRQG